MRIPVWYNTVRCSVCIRPTETVLSKSPVVDIASPAASFHASPPPLPPTELGCGHILLLYSCSRYDRGYQYR